MSIPTPMPYGDYVAFRINKPFLNAAIRYGGEDIHVVRPASGSATHALSYYFGSSGTGWELASYILDPHITLTSGAFSKISLNATSGLITVQPITPANPSDIIRNFVVKVRFNVKYIDQSSVTQTTTFDQDVRVHVHTSVTSVWVSPAAMSVWRDTQYNARFHVFANFDDMVGDISCSSDIAWNSTNAKVSINTAGIFTINDTSIALGTTNCIVAAYKGQTSTGTLNVRETLTDANPAKPKPQVELVPGGPGAGATADFTNVILLSDGFEAGTNETAFNGIANRFISATKAMNSLAPWNTLVDHINFWKCYVPTAVVAPATENSGSFNCEVVVAKHITPADTYKGWPLTYYLNSTNTWLFGGTLPDGTKIPIQNIVDPSWVSELNGVLTNDLPLLPATMATPLTPAGIHLTKLIELVGFPTRSDIDIPKATKIAKWNTLYNHGLTTGGVKDEVYTLWCLLAYRNFLNKADTPFAVTVGRKPIAFLYDDEGIDIDKYRMSRSYINSMISKASTGSTVIGGMWDATANGKDKGNVYIISRIYSTRAENHEPGTGNGYAIVGTKDRPGPVINYTKNTGSQQCTISNPLPPALNSTMLNLFLHELGHLIGNLLDEYGGSSVPDPAAFIYLARQDEQVAQWLLNTQLDTDLRTSGQIMGDKIRWRWPRYETALLLSQAPVTTGTTGVFSLSFYAGETSTLAAGNQFYLRKRKLEPVNIANQTPSPLYSCKLEIITVGSGVITFKKVNSGDTLTLGDYPRNSVAVKLIPDPFNAARWAELISSVVVTEINQTHLPLYPVTPGNVNEFQTPREDIYQAGDYIHDNAYVPGDGSDQITVVPMKLGGLYAGGMIKDEQVYHPFGACIMRQTPFEEPDVTKYGFNFMCPVCKYLLAERLYPPAHFINDKVYQGFYPKKK